MASTNVYVAGFPYSWTESDLRAVFSPFGSIDKVKLLLDRRTNQPRGVGFVDFTEASSARHAIDRLHNSIPEGSSRPITVRIAEGERRGAGSFAASGAAGFVDDIDGDAPGPGSGSGSGYGPPPGYGYAPLRRERERQIGRTAPYERNTSYRERDRERAENSTLFAANLPPPATQESLQQLFGQYGEVRAIRLPQGASKGIAFVEFVSREDAQRAIEMANNMQTTDGGRPLMVKWSHNKPKNAQTGTNGSTRFVAGTSASPPPQAAPIPTYGEYAEGSAYGGQPMPPAAAPAPAPAVVGGPYRDERRGGYGSDEGYGPGPGPGPRPYGGRPYGAGRSYTGGRGAPSRSPESYVRGGGVVPVGGGGYGRSDGYTRGEAYGRLDDYVRNDGYGRSEIFNRNDGYGYQQYSGYAPSTYAVPPPQQQPQGGYNAGPMAPNHGGPPATSNQGGYSHRGYRSRSRGAGGGAGSSSYGPPTDYAGGGYQHQPYNQLPPPAGAGYDRPRGSREYSQHQQQSSYGSYSNGDGTPQYGSGPNY